MQKNIKSIVEFARRNAVTVSLVCTIIILAGFALNACYWEHRANHWADYWCLHYNELEVEHRKLEEEHVQLVADLEAAQKRITVLEEDNRHAAKIHWKTLDRIKFLEEEYEKIVDIRKELDDKLDYFSCTRNSLSSHYRDLWHNEGFLEALSKADGGEEYLKEVFETWYYLIWLADLPKERKEVLEKSLKEEFDSKCEIFFHGKFVAGKFVSDDTVTVTSLPEGR
jgi:hypothetical protein